MSLEGLVDSFWWLENPKIMFIRCCVSCPNITLMVPELINKINSLEVNRFRKYFQLSFKDSKLKMTDSKCNFIVCKIKKIKIYYI